MSGKLILPPNYINIAGSLIFLAGPIQGTYRWQDDAIKFIQSSAPDLHIASPNRDYLDEEFVYEKQVDWETHYLTRAAKEGVIMFWFAKEVEHKCDRAYAQTSRFELGEWKVKHEHSSAKLVVGIEKGFTNARYIKRRFSQDCPDIQICNSLKETCQKAIEEVYK